MSEKKQQEKEVHQDSTFEGRTVAYIDGQQLQPEVTREKLIKSLTEDLELLELRAACKRARAEIASYTWQEIHANHKIMEYSLQQQEAQANAEAEAKTTEQKTDKK
jgi:predicted Fe-S protein YdhL (DUF1289 family)